MEKQKINKRINILRKELGNTQIKFAKKIGLSQGTLSGIEKGDVTVTDRNILVICREFNVNEEWLRRGTGEMFIELPEEDEFFKAATELSKNNDRVAMQAVIEYWKLNKESKEVFKEFITGLVRKANE